MSIVEKEWQKILKDQLNNNMFMNSPLGKTTFSCGIAFAMSFLTKGTDKKKWNELYDSLEEFTDEYMRQTRIR
jgi:hypothetical protein